MGWFPLFLNLEGKKCLVVGGGSVALRKVQTLLSYGAQVVVVAPELVPALAELDTVTRIRRSVEPNDVSDCAFVVDATGDRETGVILSELCRNKNIPLNVVDTPEFCSAIFPAVLRRGKLTAAVSTGGASPLAAVWVRNRLSDSLPDGFEEILEQMASLRIRAKETFSEQPHRAAFLKRCFAAAIEQEAPLSEEEIRAYLEQEEEK